MIRAAISWTVLTVLCMAAFSPGLSQADERKDMEARLRMTVRFLAEEIGQRSFRDVEKLNRAAQFIEDSLRSARCVVSRQAFVYKDNTYYNIIGEVKGTGADDDGIVVVGAHYDTVIGTPGADDNASAMAGLIELARMTSERPMSRTVRFVAFTLEEPPVFMTSRMGSHVYAKSLREEGAKVYGMIALEMLGFYSGEEGSQYFPLPFFRLFYPTRGNFIAFVGNISSLPFTKRMQRAFRETSTMPVESLSSPSIIPGVDFSDHRSFWKFGYRAFMVTDTAFYRNPNYHGPGDTADTLDYGKMAEVVTGLYRALGTL